MAKKKSTEMALATVESLLPANMEFDQLIENLEEMDEVNFPRISFKNGRFKLSKDDKGADVLKGVILFHGRQNTYWEGTYDPNNIVPPECFSVDGKTGSKARNSSGQFGSCRSCAYNQFGSGAGKGKACRNQKKVYIQVPGNAVPYTLFLAPTSLTGFNDGYIMNKIVQKGHQYWAVLTTFTAYQEGNDTYFKISFEVDSSFEGEEKTQLKELRDFWMPAIKADRAQLDVPGGASSSSSSSSEDESSEESEETSTRTVEARKPAPVSAPAADDAASDEMDEEDPPF